MTRPENHSEEQGRVAILSLPVTVSRLKSLGETVKAEADAAQCTELCERLGILAVHGFAIEARLTPWKKTGVRIEGHVSGAVEQACVVSLAPVAEQINEAFALTLVPAGSPFARKTDDKDAGELVVDPEGEDPPEEFEGDEIDVGLYAEEFFALALNDYPRASGVEFSAHVEDDGSAASENPFAVLAGLKDDTPNEPSKQ